MSTGNTGSYAQPETIECIARGEALLPCINPQRGYYAFRQQAKEEPNRDNRAHAEMTNSITHFEIYGDEPEKLAEFYGSVFGWHIEQMPGVDYWSVETSSPDGLHGGLMYRAIAGLNGWMFYIKVNSLEKVVADIQSFGGKVVRPKTAVPKTAWVTIVADPQGNTFGVWQSDTTALPMPEPD